MATREPGQSKSKPDRSGQRKLLIYCPQITNDTLLHFSQVGDSYRLRAFTGRLAGRRSWIQPDAPTADAFWRIYAPQERKDVIARRVNLERIESWRQFVAECNREMGIGG
jgi:hypothetical protein